MTLERWLAIMVWAMFAGLIAYCAITHQYGGVVYNVVVGGLISPYVYVMFWQKKIE